MKIKILFKKSRPDAILPTKVGLLEAGWDLYYAGDTVLFSQAKRQILLDTGICMAIPAGWYGQIESRSGLALKAQLAHRAGIIDCTWRSSVQVLLRNEDDDVSIHIIKPGDRVAQILFHEVPEVEWEEVDELPTSYRGENGWGSSGT